ncbi:MAG TPA: metal-dependent hydrolase [Trueperaceae bacterium]|nr:metal-dependent hydrolase [Trueperaceae bacterium]
MIKYLGHSAFEIDINTDNILIDPFISGNPLAIAKAEDYSPNYIILSHAHGDHVGDTQEIARRSSATVISNFEIANYFAAKGLNIHPMGIGGSFNFSFGKLSFSPAWHSSSFDDGSYGGMPMGIILEIAGKRIYHAGDTALFSDMMLIGSKEIDIAFLPIGDNFTMGPEAALEAVKMLKPKQVVPIHYNTFDLIKQDPYKFKEAVEANTDASCIVMQAGDSLDL